MEFTKEQLIERIEKQIDINATIIDRLGDDSAATSELAVKTATLDIKILDTALAALSSPQVTSVPDAIEPTYEAIKAILPTANPDEYACCIGADMWNACRAAMLNGGK